MSNRNNEKLPTHNDSKNEAAGKLGDNARASDGPSKTSAPAADESNKQR